MKLTKLIFGISALVLYSCTHNNTSPFSTNTNDYNAYLNHTTPTAFKEQEANLYFWTQKLEQQPSQYPYLSKIATVNNSLFSLTGEVQYLKNAETNLLEINQKASSAAYLRALARNYISQHKFQEALSLLKKAEADGEKILDTQKMLFDVYLEVGAYEQAHHYLTTIENNDFDYYIRASKWNDTRGDLKTAIHFLERALKIAEASKNKSLLLWTYTNLADFYGHNNELEKSYTFYLKSLAIDPDNAYAKKGIAWIVFSHEKNAEEALRIINKVQETHYSPDYYLLKAEIAEYMNNEAMKNKNIQLFLTSVQNKLYGAMYNQHLIKLYLNEFNQNEKALPIIEQEIINRPTPETYNLLAWLFYKEGNYSKALAIADQFIVKKTHEPEVLYNLAQIYKANNLPEKAFQLKKELVESSYELGPTMIAKIQNI